MGTVVCVICRRNVFSLFSLYRKAVCVICFAHEMKGWEQGRGRGPRGEGRGKDGGRGRGPREEGGGSSGRSGKRALSGETAHPTLSSSQLVLSCLYTQSQKKCTVERCVSFGEKCNVYSWISGLDDDIHLSELFLLRKESSWGIIRSCHWKRQYFC